MKTVQATTDAEGARSTACGGYAKPNKSGAPIAQEAGSGRGGRSLLGECQRASGPLTPAEIEPHYITSQPSIYVGRLGTMYRTGLCARCDAAIYRGSGPYYHATEKGLVEL